MTASAWPVVDGGLRRQAQGAAGGELVGVAAAEGGAGDAAAQDPHARACPRRRRLGEVGEVGEGGEGGGAGADDGGALARVPGADGGVLQVRDAVGDAVGGGLLAERGQAVAAGGAGVVQVPEASMTARAKTRSSRPSA